LLKIPEFDMPPYTIERDGKVVMADGQIKTTKVAIDAVWNLPGLAKRLGFSEKELRDSLFKYTHDEGLKDSNLKAYLAPIEGTTIYLFGDIAKLGDEKTEVALRVHDECSSSDTFGSDMCTCRPYLIYALQGAIECAQRGGVGVVIYFRKEGRALGEVIKFRVYNARQRQEGGDRPDMYFKQTESIAGIRDARVQELMPDIILWLGIDRIDKLLSMSSDKYDAIIGAGITVMQRVPLPEDYVPEGAMVEISAKIASGYASNESSTDEAVASLMTVDAVRKVTRRIFDLAKAKETKYFTLHLDKLDETATFVADVMKKNYPDLNIPYHSRWRHFEQLSPNIIDDLSKQWPCDEKEKVRRLIDLVTISVLLDAGTGPAWKYTDAEGNTYTRSEGLALASLDMFKSGIFSSDPAVPHRVNSVGITKITLDDFKHGLQHSKANPLASIDARYHMLQRLAAALQAAPAVYGYEVVRPGNIVDWVEKNLNASDRSISLKAIFDAVVNSLSAIWPTNSPKIKKGDVWQYQSLLKPGETGSDLVAFHKIPQWLCYSLCEPIESLGIKITNPDALTALAEYRNGGLFVDKGVITLTNPDLAAVDYDVGSELIVEWRALTIQLIDELAPLVRAKLGKTAEEMPIVKILQGGTWQAGRQIAAALRPGGPPPITVRLNGITF
jgi:GTP cyclohydrolase II